MILKGNQMVYLWNWEIISLALFQNSNTHLLVELLAELFPNFTCHRLSVNMNVFKQFFDNTGRSKL